MSSLIRSELKNALNKSYIFLIIFITSFVIGYEYHRSFVANPEIKEWQIEKFQQSFLDKEKKLKSLFNDLRYILKYDSSEYDIKFNLLKYRNKNGVEFYVYKNDTIYFWTSNQSEIPYKFSNSFREEEKPIRLKNAFYYSKTIHVNEYSIVGLIKIKDDFIIENKFLYNKYEKDFVLDDNTRISIHHCLNCTGIYNIDGKRAFSIELNPKQSNNSLSYKEMFIYIIFSILIFFLIFGIAFIKNIHHVKIKNNFVLGWILFLIIIRTILFYKLNTYFDNLELFNPLLYAASDFLPSLGDLFLHAIFLFVIVFTFYENYTYQFNEENRFVTKRIVVISLILSGLIIWFIHIFSSLIINSNISFEIYKVVDISIYTILSLISIVFIILSICLFFDKNYIWYQNVITTQHRNTIIIALVILIFTIGVISEDILAVLSIFIILLIIARLRSKKINYSLSRILILTLIFSIFSAYYIIRQASVKQVQNKKVLAVNLATEHDFIAEILLENISDKLKNDEKLSTFLSGNYADIDELNSYIKGKYFRGYLEKYDIQVIICSPSDSILIQPDNEYYHCYNFFSDYMRQEGISVLNTNFYFINNLNGRIGYFGNIIYNNEHLVSEFTLYIELQSKLFSTELGYPELLLDKRQKNTSVLTDYSYAKYHKNELIAQSGSFPYPLKENFIKEKDFIKFNEDNYKHIAYFPDDENVIVISNQKIKASDIIFTFSYLIIFYTITIGILLLLYKIKIFDNLFSPTFRNKIQFSMLLVLVISFILIGGITIYFSINQYKEKHYEIISEKLQSVQVELIHKFENEEKVTEKWTSNGYNNIEELLRKFSNVFYSDINLYNPEGKIIASSRPEIFTKNLQGSMMNPDALFQLGQNNKGEYIHNEKIGKLEYLSGYIPFFNINGKLLAYLNLPYFTRQKELTREVSSLVVAVLNIYVLLFIITTALAFFMSEQITRPLKIIQENFKRVKLGIQNEIIKYKREDEIAALINEYNRMVIELSENADKLARSEREMAWREMARQIAHEIKNPLTPMKLNIQQLQRAWKDKAENWDDYLNKVTTTLIEQINTLSSIATEFSNFAKMPRPKNEVVNIVNILKNTIKLFDQSENIKFSTYFKNYDEINIYADKEQIVRVFTNLIKNAIQAIPEGKKGEITIESIVIKELKKVKIDIKDNGRGIKSEIYDELFQPNFTTKSGGMGLGLAIVKKIIDTSNGYITFTSELNKGTCFSIEWELFE